MNDFDSAWPPRASRRRAQGRPRPMPVEEIPDWGDSSERSICSELGYARTSQSSSSSNYSTMNASDSALFMPQPTPRLPGRPKKAHSRSASMSFGPPPIPKPAILKRSATGTGSASRSRRRSSISVGSRDFSFSSSTSHQESFDSMLFSEKENGSPNREFGFGNLDFPAGEAEKRRKYRANRPRRSSMTNMCSPPPEPALPPSTRGKYHRSSSMSMCETAAASFPRDPMTEMLTSPTVPSSPPSRRRPSRMERRMSSAMDGSSSAHFSDDATNCSVASFGTPSGSTSGGSSSRKRGMSCNDLRDLSSPTNLMRKSSSSCSSGNIGAYTRPRSSSVATSGFDHQQMMMSSSAYKACAPLDWEYEEQTCNKKKARMLHMASPTGSTGSHSYSPGIESDEGHRNYARGNDDSSVDSAMDDRSVCSESDEDDTFNASPVATKNGRLGKNRAMQVRSAEDVLKTVSSYEDLKYLIKTLRSETSGKTLPASFGRANICTVTIPLKWDQSRKMAFMRWAGMNLGFTVESAGGSTFYLKTSRDRAVEVRGWLEDALVLHKKEEQSKKKTPCVPKGVNSPFVIDASSEMMSVSKPGRPSSTVPPVSPSQDKNDIDSQLLNTMNSLSLKDSSQAAGGLPLRRHVTLEPDDVAVPVREPTRTNAGKACRLSIDSLENAGPNDLIHSLHGYSPDERKSCRISRMSLSSTKSVMSASKPRHVEATPRGPGCASLFATPNNHATPRSTGWGSQPVEGRDWGGSERINEKITRSLVRRANESLQDEGKREFVTLDGPYRTVANLQLDLEMDSDCEVDEEDSCDGDMGIEISLQLDEDLHLSEKDERTMRRMRNTMAKRKRMSVWASANAVTGHQQKPLFLHGTLRKNGEIPHRDLMETNHVFSSPFNKSEEESPACVAALKDRAILSRVFSFLEADELLTKSSLVCSAWADISTNSYADLMLASVGCTDGGEEEVDDSSSESTSVANSIAASMERPWKYLTESFPTASFLSEGAFKRVYRVFNAKAESDEAISVMDVDLIESSGNMAVVGTELAVSAMLSSLARRCICPNFVVTRGVFTSQYEPPASHWGSAENKNPLKHSKSKRKPRKPSDVGRYQYIRMELCTEGDCEEYLKKQPQTMLAADLARMLLFQIAFALHAAADRFSLKHYDVKLLNVFLQDARNITVSGKTCTGDIVLRYGLGSQTFALKMPSHKALVAKLADYGTADVKSDSNGQPVTIAQLTTLENTPPDFLILGDGGVQGHGHDSFGLGLCMLHLFTGHAPYEEILSDIYCPKQLKERLRRLWEDENSDGYSVIRSVIFSDVYTDDDGNVLGEPDETFYDTLYRFLVLFGIPTEKFQRKQCAKVWRALTECLEGNGTSRRGAADTRSQFAKDRRKYSLEYGTNKFIARGRRQLESIDGGMELLASLVAFDPEQRASALDVLNSEFMAPLMEKSGAAYNDEDQIHNFMAFSVHNPF